MSCFLYNFMELTVGIGATAYGGVRDYLTDIDKGKDHLTRLIVGGLALEGPLDLQALSGSIPTLRSQNKKQPQ
jgi:hypothetical protein